MIKDNVEYIHQSFADINLKNKSFEQCYFENCTFNTCYFDDSSFIKCKFVDCSFKSCSLNLVTLTGSSFIDTEFSNCKMKGINWTQIHFPYVTVSSPIFFHNCDISFSGFYDLKVPGISIIECKAHEIDLRGTDLSSSDLSGSDFKLAQFNKTNLKSADLRNCINYEINPTENSIEKAFFSLPEAIELLNTFKINID